MSPTTPHGRRRGGAVLLALALAVTLATLLALAAGAAAAPPRADAIYYGGKVWTGDPAQPAAQAIAVKGHRILYVGSNMGAARYYGPRTTLVDLRGRRVLPGFIDAHMHASSAVRLILSVDLYALNSVTDYLDAVAEFAAAHPDLPAILGSGWSNTVVPGIGPLASDLDSVVSDRPVAIQSQDYHSLWVNSKALELAGIDGSTPDPVGGKIERLPDSVSPENPYGIPSGTLRESAMDLVTAVLPDYTVDQYKQGLRYFQRRVAGPLGITGVYDPLLGIGSNAVQAYEELAAAGRLTLRVRGALSLEPGDDLATWLPAAQAERAKHTHALFRTEAVKFFADGVVEGHTAWLKEPYADAEEYAGDPDYAGFPLWDDDALADAFTAVDAAGFQIHVHAIGDAATTQVLDALAVARQRNGAHDWRPGITHLQLVDPADYERFAELGVTAVPQPYWFVKDDYYTYLQVPYLGLPRADYEYPMKSFFDHGVLVASASDFPVTIPPDPLDAIQTGVMRWFPGLVWEYPPPPSLEGVLWPEERVTVAQMVRSFTRNAARACFTDRVCGVLKKGMSADFIVLSRDIFRCPPADIGTAEVLRTVFRGEVVYRAR